MAGSFYPLKDPIANQNFAKLDMRLKNIVSPSGRPQFLATTPPPSNTYITNNNTTQQYYSNQYNTTYNNVTNNTTTNNFSQSNITNNINTTQFFSSFYSTTNQTLNTMGLGGTGTSNQAARADHWHPVTVQNNYDIQEELKAIAIGLDKIYMLMSMAFDDEVLEDDIEDLGYSVLWRNIERIRILLERVVNEDEN